jgi:hypothetical protein
MTELVLEVHHEHANPSRTKAREIILRHAREHSPVPGTAPGGYVLLRRLSGLYPARSKPASAKRQLPGG